MRETIEITGVWLVRLGDKAIVRVEIDGRWIDVIEEHAEGSFSHIAETGGILRRKQEAIENEVR